MRSIAVKATLAELDSGEVDAGLVKLLAKLSLKRVRASTAP